ncbi:prepilin-type N-terminal cleavage/methylation domain-containing protein [Candidatus Reidiella endopervernicosa]
MCVIQNRGFSLIELIMVIILLGIVAVVAVPRLPSITDFDEMGFFDELVGAARYGQKLAIATNCKVELEVTASSYALSMPSSVGNCFALSPTFSTDVPHHSASGQYSNAAPSGVSISNPATIVFDASGGTSTSHTFSIDGRSFTVHATSGYVERL